MSVILSTSLGEMLHESFNFRVLTLLKVGSSSRLVSAVTRWTRNVVLPGKIGKAENPMKTSYILYLFKKNGYTKGDRAETVGEATVWDSRIPFKILIFQGLVASNLAPPVPGGPWTTEKRRCKPCFTASVCRTFNAPAVTAKCPRPGTRGKVEGQRGWKEGKVGAFGQLWVTLSSALSSATQD